MQSLHWPFVVENKISSLLLPLQFLFYFALIFVHGLRWFRTKLEGFLDFFYFYVRYSTLLHLPPLRFPCAAAAWCSDRSNPGLLRLWHWQPDALTTRIDLIHRTKLLKEWTIVAVIVSALSSGLSVIINPTLRLLHCYKDWRDFPLPRPGAADSFHT